MEEILASIRRIIADDEPAAEAKPAAPAPKPAAPAPAAAKPAPAPSPPVAEEPAAEPGQDDIDAMLASFDAPAVPGKEEPAPAKVANDEDVLDLTKPVAKPAGEDVEFREPKAAAPEPEPEEDAWAAAEAMEEEAPPPPTREDAP